jgi:hypothetical protein
MDELPMDQLFAFSAWAMANDGWLQFSGAQVSGKGYRAQESARLMDIARQHKKKWQTKAQS